ncbi:hypothetical protein PQ796_30765 (plasmid) [Priestia megaterium]|uniref:hypothetical protein n=1 Tax=Priestia megaterium TaxID=1404 RepID=UPI0024494DDC|nr:hypothetical protein [Priestia megaterium]MDH2454861.1 hypothetical protein [Priestia megaterium]MDL5154317.1 hypothetical protein [Priestia megaterium]
MSNYRKKMFRGAKIEDCIIDFIDMEKELNKSIKTTTGDEKLLLSGMSKAYRMIVNRLVREFDYSKGGITMNVKITDLIESLKKRAIDAKNQSSSNTVDVLKSGYYNEIPDEAKEEIKKVPQEFQKGLFEGMSIAYEKIIIDLESLLKTEDSDKLIHVERLLVNYQRLIEMLKGKFELNVNETTYRSGYLQGESSIYQIVKEEMEMIFDLHDKYE